MEAVVIGGGVMGCSILHALAARGVTDTLLLERNVLASGSTGKTQGILRMHYSNEVTTRMAWESLRVFRDFQELTGAPSGYTRTGYLLIAGPQDRGALEKNVALGQELGVDTRLVSADDVREVAPVVSVADDETFAYEPDSGYADSYLVTTGYARRAQELGARVRTGVTVTGVETDDGRVRAVVAGGERIETPLAVVATGPWSKPFLAGLGVDLPLATVRHQILMLRRPEAEVPEHPAIADLVNDLSTRPDANNLTLLGAGEDEAPGPDEYDQGVDAAMLETYFEALIRRMPGMANALFRGGWAGLFTTTPDWHPILDRVPGVEGLYCAVGFSGHGFKLSPMVGVAMAELITQGRGATIDVSPLAFDRFQRNAPLRSSYRMQVLA